MNTTRKERTVKVLSVLLIALVSMGAEGECTDEAAVEAEIAQTVEAAPTVRPEATMATTPKISIIRVTAEELWQAYDANELAADQRYRDKVLEVTGTVSKVGRSYNDEPYIELDTRQDFTTTGVRCYFAEEHVAQFASLQVGDPLVVRGRNGGIDLFDIEMHGCTVVS